MTILLYCVSIMAVSLAGGWMPLSRRLSHLSLQVYLSFSAGAMLGAAFFHMLPESAELAAKHFGGWLALGVIGLYMLERFLSPHSHDTSCAEAPQHNHEECEHLVHQEGEPRPAAPQLAGWSAVAGLYIHTLLGGIALGSAILGPDAPAGLGLAVFLATVLHKPADAFTISTLLVKGGVRRKTAVIIQLVFALLIPVGIALFYFGRNFIAEQLDTTFTGCVLAFSAGTFLCIALSDLLPEVQFHSHDRGKLAMAVILGALLMWSTSLFEPSHGHGGAHEHESAMPVAGAKN